jgi:phosphate-selective porin OprO/OprP
MLDSGLRVARERRSLDHPRVQMRRRSWVGPTLKTWLKLALVGSLVLGSQGEAVSDSPQPADPATPAATDPSRVERVFDRIWGFATLYDDPDGPILREFAFRGRFQVDFPVFGGNHGHYREPQVRRLRLGFQSFWNYDLTLHVEADLDTTCEQGENCDDDAYEGLTDAYLGWAPSEAFYLQVGKLSAPFTLDGMTSSRKLLTLERNNVSNNLWFPVEYHAGASARGKVGDWRYQVAAYSSSTTENFGTFDGGYFLLFTVGHDFRRILGGEQSLLTFNYVYNDPNDGNVSTRDLSHVASLHFQYDRGSWGVRSDLSGGIGYGEQPDLIGFAVMPFYSLPRGFQLVGRYTHLTSFGDHGVRFSRYESRISSARGDAYNELFTGLNWFIYGHRFKLQTGVRLTMMDDLSDGSADYRGWGWTFGFRMSW